MLRMQYVIPGTIITIKVYDKFKIDYKYKTSLTKIYEEADDNRKLAAPMEDLMESWKDLNNLVDNHDDETKLSEIQRDGHCHEAVMWFVHHITEDMKQILKETTDITIPLLSPNWHGKTCTDVMKSTDNNNDETYKQVCVISGLFEVM